MSSKSWILLGDGDQEFEPTADMLVHDFDDEQTLAEEEAIAIAGGEDPQNELNNLQKVSIWNSLWINDLPAAECDTTTSWSSVYILVD